MEEEQYMTNAQIHLTFRNFDENRLPSENDIRRYIRQIFKNSNIEVDINYIDFLDENAKPKIYPCFSKTEPRMVD